MRNLMIARSIIAAAALSGAAACVSVTQIESSGTRAQTRTQPPATAQEALRGYYDRLATEVSLPQAHRGAVFDTSQTLTRLGFGSCNHHDRSQDMWPVAAAKNPQLFLAIGDNVYGDYGYRGGAALGSFRAAYEQQAGHAEFQAFRRQVPMMATWDDHDYGPNDSGGSFFAKEWSERIFETFWHSPERVKARPGIYDSVMIGPDGKRVQLIMLDTRFFRSNLVEGEFVENLGGYDQNLDPQATMLGAEQWAWLQRELAKPADLRILVSSIQVLTDAHRWEAWSRMPLERERLYEALADRNGGGLVMLSGDRHQGAIYKHRPEALGEEVWEFTSSSMNLAFLRESGTDREPDPKRVTPMVAQENFGMVEIDWAVREVTFDLLDDSGATIEKRSSRF